MSGLDKKHKVVHDTTSRYFMSLNHVMDYSERSILTDDT